MSEIPFHKAQIGPQAGTFYVPGASVPAITILPVTTPANSELDRATQYPLEDYGRNIDAQAGRGYHGVRGVTIPLEGEWTFEQAMHVLEMHNKGAVIPTGSGPYVWVYPLEVGLPTLIPYTIEDGSETSQDQWETVGVLIDELTVGFDDLDAPGAHPWTFQGSGLGLNRVPAALTGSLGSTAVETMQGQWTILKEGSTATAFASLSELAASLISFQQVTRRSLVLRPYGGAGDAATGYGFSAKTSVEVTAKVKISATAKTNIHDAWDNGTPVITEKRWRLSVDGGGNNAANLDLRLGMTGIPIGERDGERVYEITGKGVYDATLLSASQWSITNDIADLTP